MVCKRGSGEADEDEDDEDPVLESKAAGKKVKPLESYLWMLMKSRHREYRRSSIQRLQLPRLRLRRVLFRRGQGRLRVMSRRDWPLGLYCMYLFSTSIVLIGLILFVL